MLLPLQVEGRPHWERRFPKEVWPAFEDFRNFLALTWAHLGLPSPTPAQYEIAHRLQYGADSVEWALLSEEEQYRRSREPREDIIRAFRAFGKSYITAAYAIWRLLRNPRDEKVLVISATGSKASEFVAQVKAILQSMTLVMWLLEGTREKGSRRRDESKKFDVAASSNSQSYSMKAVGLNGQITGSRATLIIPDDIESEANSRTEDARARILTTIRSDFGPVRKTEHGVGDIIFLGTPQTEESVYNVLVKEMLYSCYCIPARYPRPEKLENYILTVEGTGERMNILAHYLRSRHDAGELPADAPTDTRLSREELARAEAQGRSAFALQYMLDTSLSDAERYPLRQHDLIVFATNPIKAPITIQWGRHNDRKNIIPDIPNLGFSGDHFMGPLFADQEWREYEGKVMFVDPSGRGADETGWAIVGSLNGMLYALHVDGYSGDPAEAMLKIALDAKRFGVNVIEVEPNYGQGMWSAAFIPMLQRVWPAVQKVVRDPVEGKRVVAEGGGCTVLESEWSKGQKETRIIDTLEPVLTQHRLILDEQLIRNDTKQRDRKYSFLFQLTHITKERGALQHEDRLEALAGAVAHFQRTMQVDAKEAAAAQLQAEREELIDEFLELFESDSMFSSGGGRAIRRRGKHRGDDVVMWRS